MPVVLLAVLWPFGAFLDPAFAPRLQWPLFAIGLSTGSFEEVGWTGFATPRLLARHRLFVVGLSLGLAWALWHVWVDFRQNFDTMGTAWLLEFALFYLAALTAYRLLMIWVYANTHSLFLAVLMHASYTGWLLVLYPATSFEQGLVWQTAFAVALWLVVAVVVLGFVHVSRGLLRRRCASSQSTDHQMRPHTAALIKRVRTYGERPLSFLVTEGSGHNSAGWRIRTCHDAHPACCSKLHFEFELAPGFFEPVRSGAIQWSAEGDFATGHRFARSMRKITTNRPHKPNASQPNEKKP